MRPVSCNIEFNPAASGLCVFSYHSGRCVVVCVALKIDVSLSDGNRKSVYSKARNEQMAVGSANTTIRHMVTEEDNEVNVRSRFVALILKRRLHLWHSWHVWM